MHPIPQAVPMHAAGEVPASVIAQQGEAAARKSLLMMGVGQFPQGTTEAAARA